MAPEAWYLDSSAADQRLPHKLEPSERVAPEQLTELGVLYWKLDADNWKEDSTLKQIRKDRGYTYEDLITIRKEELPNYDEKIKSFFEEHIHRDEEIRFVLDGSGYFDVRDKSDRWIRVAVQKGDLLVFPAGIYHRFTLDTNDYISALRLYVSEPVWTPYNRPADDLEARKAYVAETLGGN